MSAILDALTIIADPLAPATYVRQQSGLLPTQVGYLNTVDGLAKWDQSIETALITRAAQVETDLDEAAGRYTWPFDEATIADLWPDKLAADAERAATDILSLAVDVAVRRVIADFIAKADKRAGLPYSQQAKLDYEQADAVLATAVKKIQGAVSRAAQAASGAPAVPTMPRSTAVRVRRVY